MAYRPVGVYLNPTWPTTPQLASILKDRDIYQPGGVSYGFDTSRAELAMILKPRDSRRVEYSMGGEPEGLPADYLPYLGYQKIPKVRIIL